MKNTKRTLVSRFSRLCAPALAALALAPCAPAQELPPVNGVFNFDADMMYAPAALQAPGGNTTYNIADGVTVTIANANSTGNGGVFQLTSARVFTVAPTGSTGRLVFLNNTTTGEGGVIYSGKSWLLTNVSFIGNSTTHNNGGGALRTLGAASPTVLDNVYFEKNHAPTAGAIKAYSGISVTTGTFAGNYADSTSATRPRGFGGAILFQISGNKPLSVLRENVFADNWSAWGGGAVGTWGNHSVEFWDTPAFSGNFTGLGGGALHDTANTGVADVDGISLRFTGTTGASDFVYSGNVAKGAVLTAAEVAAARSGSIAFTPAAKGGGFYYSGTLNTRLRFDLAAGVTVSIGQAGNPSSWDSIASSDAGGDTGKIDLTGAGRLVLHADNSYWQGAVNLNAGALFLGNPNARLGGAVTVASGATLGGSGTLVTRRQDGTVAAGRTSVTLDAGATLAVGTDTATDAETLAVLGNVTAGAGVTFNHDLFAGGTASRLNVAGDLALAGPATINIGLLATGTFTLMEWSGAGLSSLAGLSLTIAGAADSPRSDATLSLDGGSLVITNTAVNNLVLRWTGAEGGATGGEWTRRPTGAQRNWAAAGALAEDRFFNADSVVFDGEADADHPASRDITIEAGGVVVSGMEVSGTARYVFRGEGGIEADAGAAGGAAFAPTGRLKKSGAGELVFANTGTNTFAGGIEIAGGALVFDRAAQLGAGADGIVFSDSGTLRALAAVGGTLAETITIAAGKTAGLLVDEGAALVHGGTLVAGGAGATLRKTGAGAVLLIGANAGFSGSVAVDEGALTLAETAALGGAVTVASGATLGGSGTAGAGGSVKVAAGGILDAGLDGAQAGTLTVRNLALAGDAVLRLGLFTAADTGGYLKSDRILGEGTASISGVNNINLASFASGTFNLGNLTGLAAPGAVRVTLSGMTLLPDGRLSAELADAGGVLRLVTTADQSRVMTWTGSSGSTWSLAAASWTDGGAVNQFSYGDRVVFDGVADAAQPGSRDIFVDAEEVRVADMTVGGGEDYTFTGGGIHAGAGNVQPDAGGVAHITDATGKLVKTGAGTLTLANAANTFTGGVEIDGGVLAFSRGDQLATPGGAGIAFHGGGTLRAAADLALDAAVSVAPGVTGVIDSAGHALALGGALTGAADSALAKTGDGALALGADLGGFSGTLAVRAGVVRAGAAGLLTAASDAGAVISIDAGATLDLDGHDQTLARLQGAGTVGLGPARLTMDIGADTGFAGGFAGAGTVVKQGAGKWTLSGPSSHTGGVILEEGRLGLAHNEALGAGALTVTAPAAALDIEADGLAVANDIAAGSNTLTLATRGRGAEFSGKISGGRLVIEGTGTLALSGNNTVALEINNARTIAKRAESIADIADIRDGSVLEFQDVGSGQVRGSLRGGRVLFTSSTLSLNGANTLRAFTVGADSRITAAAVDALGGAAAAVRVAEGGWLKIVYPGTPAGGMDVDGGALVFAPVSGTGMSSVALSGALNFTNGGEIRLDGIMPTGIYTAAVAYGGIPRPPAYDPHQGGMFMVADIVNGDTLRVTAYNKALEPGKDIVVGFDALLAATRAVYSHVSEEFIAPFSDKAAGPDGRALWFRAIGSFAEYGDDAGHLGHTAASYGGIVGYDWISSRDLMAGVYAGYTAARLETTNNATTDMGLPHLGFYGALRRGKLYAAADVNLGSGSADTVRREDHGNTVTGSYNLDHAGAKLEVGCTVPLFARGSLRPSLGLHYMSLDFRHYAETGQGAVRLDNLGARTVQAVFGCDAAKEITTAWGLPGMVDLSAGWRQRIHAKITDAWATLVAYPDARLQIRGDDYDSSGVTAGVGLRLALSRRMLFALAYDFDYIPAGNHDNDTIRHTFNSLIRLSW